jgi:hypothetical protein
MDDGNWKELCRDLCDTMTDRASCLYDKVASTRDKLDKFVWGKIEWHEEHKMDSGRLGYFSPWYIKP